MSHDKELIERMALEKNDKKLIDLLADEAIDDWKSQDGWRYADFDAALRWMFKRGVEETMRSSELATYAKYNLGSRP